MRVKPYKDKHVVQLIIVSTQIKLLSVITFVHVPLGGATARLAALCSFGSQ